MCDGTQFDVVIDLQEHPLVNSLIRKADLNKKEPMFPLVVKRCRKCSLVQLVEIIDSEEIYRNVDYLFFSSDMPTLSDYFKGFANDIQKRFIKSKNDLVVEIGSNDGVMLNHFKNKARILGVDPSTNVVLRAVKRGIPTMSEFFTGRLGGLIAKEWGTAKVVMGSNCIAHLNNLRDLLEGVRALLAPDGVFIVEANYWGGMVKNTNYSLIYHDHFSYFSLKVWQDFAKKYGLRVFDAVVTPAQGGSLRIFMDRRKRPVTKRLKALEATEKKTKLNTLETGHRYRDNVWNVAKKLRKTLEDLKKGGAKLAGYGAAAKGFTILRCSGIDGKFLDYFVDDSPAKQGWYTPIDHIPIISRKEAEKRLPDYFVILAPNYAKVIVEKEKKFHKAGGRFVVPIGNIDIL
ncbi:MAG: methyltransferase domain-containing protein [Parcubacteria group bacterium]|nr:methyltransferase domain-containing protein [Parcubacteria group bacterium]